MRSAANISSMVRFMISKSWRSSCGLAVAFMTVASIWRTVVGLCVPQ